MRSAARSELSWSAMVGIPLGRVSAHRQRMAVASTAPRACLGSRGRFLPPGCGISEERGCRARSAMRNPLNWRNTANAPYLATYVENKFARANAFWNRPRRNVDPWPTFEWARAERLPVPHLPTVPGAIECYDRCWEIAF